MIATMLARVVGYLRDTYVAYAFGAGPVTDAYVAAFTLPDFLLYLAAGGSISVTFISLFTRYIAEKREEEAQQVFSVILSVMVVVFTLVIILGEIFAPQFVGWYFKGSQVQLCITLTRILLPQPLFFLMGAIVSAVLQTKRQFLIPAFAPIVYTAFIIAGGVLLSKQIGIASLAVGATLGSLIGPFLMNAVGAKRTGIGFKFAFNPRLPAFREWLWMSIPLMLGVSVVAADEWILRYFASFSPGDVTRLNYAKRLMQVPVGVLGQAVGLASLPFFARLYSEKRFEDFESTVNNSVYRLGAISLIATSWMLAVALPLVDIALRRGRFNLVDTQETALYFLVFSMSLIFWAVQGLYARGFYAAGDTVRPMVAGTLVTIFSLPIYWFLFQRMGIIGLALASNIAILLHTFVLAGMLDRRGLVRLSGLNWLELTKALATAFLAGATAIWAGKAMPYAGTHMTAIMNIGFVSITWAAAVAAGLWLTRSELLAQDQQKV
ncbi:MAG: integral rane protein MviN [Acidobacteriales bacterium]|nr:integral rane protein MviN [Terriglobales bacterium]